MIPLFKVKKAGAYGSIQDRGRPGYQRFGVPVSGAMDQKSYQFGQYILGNNPNTPSLELFLGGQEFEVLQDHRIVLTGADLEATLDGEPVPIWKSFMIFRGQILRFSKPLDGSIAYISPDGGFYSEPLLGSASVYPKGLLGTPLKKGMILYGNQVHNGKFQTGLCSSERPEFFQQVEVKVWRSPHEHLFSKDAVEKFFTSTYTLKTGDRMGYLLEGPQLEFIKGSDILSEATQFGTIQVPNSGQPIILMADAQTIGGYATIGKVAQADLWKVAQLKRGGEVRFIRR
jgi:biotin-dependent carboxylase-like uncharacterized protein